MTKARATPAHERLTTGTVDRAVRRIVAAIYDGLNHGHFEYVLTCEVVGQERRRLILRAGKSYQFVIPKEECGPQTGGEITDSCERSDSHAV